MGDVPKMVSKLALERSGWGEGRSCLPTEAERCTCCSEEQMTESLWSEVARTRTGSVSASPTPRLVILLHHGSKPPLPALLRSLFVNDRGSGFVLLFLLIAFAPEPVCSQQSAPSSPPPELFDLLVWVQLFRFFAITSLEGGWP